MTENAFPFEGAVEESAGDDRRKMVLLAGVGALIVAVLGYFVVMPAFAGGGSDSVPITIMKKAPQKKAKTPAKTVAKKAPVQPKQYDDLAGRSNPFRPLWTEPKEAVAVAAPNGAVAPADTAAPTTSGGTTTTGGTTTAPSGGTQASYRVTLMGVFTKNGVTYAQTKVGETVYMPKQGTVFAYVFKLIGVTSKTATYLYGDEQFTLSVGQEVLK